MLLDRCKVVHELWNHTQLGAAEVVGAVWVIEHAGGFPVSRLTLQAAAWIGYKAYATTAYEKLTDFACAVYVDDDEKPARLEPGVKQEEMRLLEAVGFGLPAVCTPLDYVYEVAQGQDLATPELDCAMVMSLLKPDLCKDMTREQFTRCVVFAAAYLAGKVVTGLDTNDVSNEYIFHYGLKLGRNGS